MRSLLAQLAPAALFVVLGSAGCKPSGSGPAARDAEPPSKELTSPADAGTSDVSEASVRAVLDAWLAAQNNGAFAEYEALYAPRFEGVRRSGTQTARLDRQRWMREREAMFKQKTTVTAKDVVVRAAQAGATVSFVQTWISDVYRDEGPKRMVLALSDGKLRIAREEMLASKVIGPGALPPDKLAFVVHAGGAHVVLDAGPREGWETGPPATVSLGEPVTTRKAAGTLPPELAAWEGRRVALFGKSGIVCEGTIGALSIVGRVIPHFGVTTRWSSTGDHEGKPKPPAAEIAKEAWELTGGEESGRLLVGEVRADKGDCKDALWGRPAQAERPVLVGGRPADPTTKDAALAALRKTKAYADLQRTYLAEKQPGDPPRWEDFEAKQDVQVFAHPTGGTIVTLAIHAGHGCGTFGGTLSAAWEEKDKALVLVHDPVGQELAPLSAGDVDGDGKLDLLIKEGIMRSRGNKLGPPVKLTIPFLDCGC